ncbi:phage/plasmid primase, P4 family [Roseomonas chloroacetimidivorans]|uniref:phage/plasmid primase, P4 family n=1 Tax=Roseomonas chloroacetimidivorans TaxID=1766656 RepID=UPI003C7642E0
MSTAGEIDFGRYIGPVARKLFGEPNEHLSSKDELRFGSHGSLSVCLSGEKRGTWFDHEANEGGGVLKLLERERRLKGGDAIDWLRREVGADIPDREEAERGARSGGLGTLVATYDYTDADGKLLFQVCRFRTPDGGKTFRQRRPDPQGRDGWNWSVKGIAPVPYRLPKLMAAEGLIFIVEGEKDVHTLERLGFVATCNPGGAGKEPESGRPYKPKWPHSFAQFFRDKDVVILPDNDAVGRSHAKAAAANVGGTARRVRILSLPALAPKGDVSDWVEDGGTAEELLKLVEDQAEAEAPKFRPASNRPPESEGGAPAIWLNIGSDAEIAQRVADDLAATLGEVVHDEGEFWHHNGRHWAKIEPDRLWRSVFIYDGALFKTAKGEVSNVKISKARVESVLACMRALLVRTRFFAQAAIGINCATGFITFDEAGVASIRGHHPDHRQRHMLVGAWPRKFSREERERSLLNKLLTGCFMEEAEEEETPEQMELRREDRRKKIDLLAEVAGIAALGSATRLIQPKALVMHGKNAENGKSQILALLRSLLPKDAVATISPAKFDDRTFLCHLAGKLLNAPDELSLSDAIASETFKQVITGEPMTVRDVYKSAFEMEPRAQHVYATNNLPAFKGGMDRGVRRRLMMLVFNRVIPLEERVEHIGQRIGEEEADLLLDWAVRGASRLIAARTFTTPASSVTALTEWIFTSDPVLGWLESDEVEYAKGNYIPQARTRDAYDKFSRWALDEGFKNLPGMNSFTQRVEAAGKGITRKRLADGPRFFGLGCKGAGMRQEQSGMWRQ